MKKCIITKIVNSNAKIPITIIIAPIDCSSNDEPSIKHAIESRKHDPNVLIAIMMRYVPRVLFREAKPIMDEVKKLVQECESIEVSFLDLTEVANFVKTLQKDSILHNYCPN